MQNATNPAINPTGSPQKARFVELLEELFQLNQPELDFGLYRIVHARSKEIRAFMQTELATEIDAAFAGQASQTAHSSLEAARLVRIHAPQSCPLVAGVDDHASAGPHRCRRAEPAPRAPQVAVDEIALVS